MNKYRIPLDIKDYWLDKLAVKGNEILGKSFPSPYDIPDSIVYWALPKKWI